jgi:hypothetical protein
VSSLDDLAAWCEQTLRTFPPIIRDVESKHLRYTVSIADVWGSGANMETAACRLLENIAKSRPTL